MKTKRLLFLEAVKDVMVNMAAEDNFPLDLTQLDMRSIGDKAEKKLENDEDYQRACMVEKLGQYISENDVIDALNKLEKQAEIDGNVMADDVVMMWKPFEFQYTVDQLLEQIL